VGLAHQLLMGALSVAAWAEAVNPDDTGTFAKGLFRL